MLIRLLVGISLLSVLNGCAGMFNQNQDRAEVFGPKGITATDPDGNQLTIHHEYDQQFLMLPRYDTFVTFHYGTASERVLLQRSYCSSTLLDYLTFWGLYIDDALGTWRQYDPLIVILDSNGGVDTTLPLPSFWEHENRLRLLLSLGSGIPTEVYQPLNTILLHGEYSIGFGIQHKIELYYNASGEGVFGEGIDSDRSLPSIAIQSPVLRYYPFDNYCFFEAGPSLITVTMDSAWWNPGTPLPGNPEYVSQHLTGLTAGVGWCGDLSYFDFRYEFGFKPYQFFQLAPQQLRELVLTFGMTFNLSIN